MSENGKLERMRPSGPVHSIRICSQCGGYMTQRSNIESIKGMEHWKHESKHRSFGGYKLQAFVCEKCGHYEIHQIDTVGEIEEDQ